MKKKTYILKIFILGLSIAPFFSLRPSSYKPAGKRPLSYAGPMPVRPIPQAPIVKSIQKQPIMDVADETSKKEPEKSEAIEKKESEELEAKPERVSDAMQAQKDLPSPGFFASMYATIAPIILITLDKAMGTGIAKSTKNLIDQFLARRVFIKTKNEIFQDLEKESKEPLSEEEKLASTKIVFAENKLDYDKLEKEASFPSIFAQAAYVGILNVAVNAMGTLFGYATKIGLNALMPDQK